MTISILIKQARVGQLVPNPSYNPEESEDDTYNPKQKFQDSYPTLVMPDHEGRLFMHLLGVINSQGVLTELDELIARVESFDHAGLASQGLPSVYIYSQAFIHLANSAKANSKELVYLCTPKLSA